MKIFGVGLSKTGTYSLHFACLELGFKSQHWSYTKDIVHYKQNDIEIDFSMLEDYDAFFDTPIAKIYKVLDQKYPGSKFILTERDTDSWLKSYKKFFPPYSVNETENLTLRLDIYGTYEHDDVTLCNAFERHNRQVKDYFRDRPDDLLCITVGKGDEWTKLCKFLSVPVPNRPFPITNTRSHNRLILFHEKFRRLVNQIIPRWLRKKIADKIWPYRASKYADNFKD